LLTEILVPTLKRTANINTNFVQTSNLL